MTRPALASLQPDVTLQRDDAGKPVALVDTLLGRTVTLGPAAALIAERLDGTRALADVCEAVAAEHGSRADVEAAARSLMCLNMVSGCGDAIREQIASAAGRLEYVTLQGARFECQGSGACCQNYQFGPLSDDDVTLLQELARSGRFPRQADEPLMVEKRTADGSMARYLPTVDDHCVHLGADQRCGLHAVFGPTGKPGFCRLYPLEVLKTVEGMKFYDRGTCGALEVSGASGRTLLAQAVGYETVFPRQQALYHPIVFLEGRPLDYGYFLRLSHLLQRVVDQPGVTPLARIRAAARVMREWSEVLGNMPVTPEALDGVLREVENTGVQQWYDHNLAGGHEAFTRLMEEVLEMVRGPLANGTSRRLVAELLPRLEMLCGQPRLPVASVTTDVMLRRSLKQHLFGRQALLEDRPTAALLRLAVVHLVTLMDPEQPSRAHMLGMRVLESCGDVFLRHDGEGLGILQALPEAG